MRLLIAGLVLVLAGILASQPVPREQVGPLQDGGFRLNSGWLLHPVGKQVPLDTFPMSTALSPDGRFLLVLNAGYKPPSISVLDVSSATEVRRTPVPDAWLGLTFSPKGDRVYVGGGSRAAVYEFSYSGATLEPTRSFPVVPEDKKTPRDFIGDVAISPDGRLLYAADLYRDSVVVINPQSGMVIERFRTGRRPYRIVFHPDGKSFFVTSWVDGTLGHYDAATGSLLANVRLGPHPTDMVWRPGRNEPAEGEPAWTARLFVTASNTNNVYVLGISESKEIRQLETINVAMTPRQPVGMTPSALALGAHRNRLYVVCSDANAVAVVDVSQERSQVLGFVPTGWYPTAARSLGDGRLVVLNGRGLRSLPNPEGPNPSEKTVRSHPRQYVGRIQTGTASFIDPPSREQLAEYSRQVLANSPYRDSKLDDSGTGANGLIPSKSGAASPIRHVLYIVKENRTYDQVLGDMKQGNGDPGLVLFGEEITPNLHKLAREFVLLDNFYVSSDVSADGHSWSTAAIATDYIQKLWPNSYGGRRKLYDYEGQEPASTPPAGYLWTNAAAAGVSMRNYGHLVENRPKGITDGVQIARVRDPILRPLTNMYWRGFDLDYPDVERVKVFLRDLSEFERTGQMPGLLVMRLGNDHTNGTAAGKIAPLSLVADNDYALGLLVEGVSKSRFWASTAIFVLEDDAQNGPDHVDSHRSPAFVISPFVRKHTVDSSMYNTVSMLRTMELILGLRPMTHFDAAARPMSNAFQMAADPAVYRAEKPRISLTNRNPAAAPGSRQSALLDFHEADLADDDQLNDILWLALRTGPPPPVVRTYFGR